MKASHLDELPRSPQGNKNAIPPEFPFSYPSILEGLKDDKPWCFLLYQFEHSLPLFNPLSNWLAEN